MRARLLGVVGVLLCGGVAAPVAGAPAGDAVAAPTRGAEPIQIPAPVGGRPDAWAGLNATAEAGRAAWRPAHDVRSSMRGPGGGFGTALAAGDLGGDGAPDLAIGAAEQGAGGPATMRPVGSRLAAWGTRSYSLDRLPQDAEPAAAVAAVEGFSMSIRRDGVPVMWGDISSPAPGVGRLRQAAAAGLHVVAVRRNGTVVAWPAEESDLAAQVPAGLRRVRSVATAWSHSVALRRDGTVVAWGQYTDRCGDWGCVARPAKAPAGLSGVTAIGTGGEHSLALRNDGTVVGWGSTGNSAVRVPGGLKDVVAVAAGGRMQPERDDVPYPDWVNRDFSAALRRDGTVVLWGDGLPSGCQLSGIRSISAGDGLLVAVGRDSRVRTCAGVLRTVPGVRSVAVGGTHVLALRRDGRIAAWSLFGMVDQYGETHVPARPRGSIVGIAAGSRHSLALTRRGTVLAWGSNLGGAATPPKGLRSVVAVAAGRETSYALRSDGTVVAWGRNYTGQTDVPTGLRDVVAIAAGSEHVLALRRDGTVVGWGARCDDPESCSFAHGAADVPLGLSGVVAVAAGDSHSLALKRDGTVVAWAGVFSAGSPAVDVPAGLRDVKAIAAGDTFSLALRKDGSLVSWGYRSFPHPARDLVSIAAAPGHAAAVRRDGRLIYWWLDAPEQVLPFTHVTAISVGEYHGLALRRRR